MSKREKVTFTVEVKVKPRIGVWKTKHQDSKKVKNQSRKLAKKLVKEYFNI